MPFEFSPLTLTKIETRGAQVAVEFDVVTILLDRALALTLVYALADHTGFPIDE